VQGRNEDLRGHAVEVVLGRFVQGIGPAWILAEVVKEDGSGPTVERHAILVAGFAEDRLLGQPGHHFQRPVPGDDPVFAVHDQGRVRQEFDDVVQPPLGPAQGLLGQDSVGNLANQDEGQIVPEVGEAGLAVPGVLTRRQ